MLRFFLAVSLCTLAAPLWAQNSAPEPFVSRLAPRPAWQETLTPRLERLPQNVDSPASALAARGEIFDAAMSRAARLKRLGSIGQSVWWRAEIALPAQARRENWPVVLEIDETRVVQGAWLDGVALPKFSRRDLGDVWSSGEGSALLPLDSQKTRGMLVLKTIEQPKNYTNGFGQLRMRPATLSEVLSIEKSGGEREVTLKNGSNAPLDLVLHVRHEDYFGAPLSGKDQKLTLGAGASQVAALDVPANSQLYKTRVWASSGQRVSLDHWMVRTPRVQGGASTLVQSLAGDWEWVFVAGPHDQNPPPQSGWKKGALEHTTHWMWARKKFTVPADWPATRKIQIALPNVGNHVSMRQQVWVNGKLIGDVAQWELPRRLDLPDVAPGSEHEMTIGLTDYVAGLVPGTALPKGGPGSVTGRKTMAPMPNVGIPMGIGFNDKIEVWGVNAVRTDWAQIVTAVANPKLKTGSQTRANLEISNDLGREMPATVEANVYARGQKVFTIPAQKLVLGQGQTTKTTLAANWQNPRLWQPEDPFLHELRVQIKDLAGNVLDERRERFGFREWGIEANYFTLNGERINILGGSHIELRNFIWPQRAHPYRVLRYSGGSIDLSDELGHLVKPESGNTNAHGQDNYAWNRPEMWARLQSRMKNQIRVDVNRPSVFMWDVGNEISFPGPGEADKMGELFRALRAFDPTRLVSVGGGEPYATGAQVFDVHGWGEANTRTDYFYYHPEERPSYLKNQGIFNFKPANEPAQNWTLDLKNYVRSANLRPGNTSHLSYNGGRVAFFSEGHYYNEFSLPPYLFGHDAYAALPLDKGSPGGWYWGAQHSLNMLAVRSLSLQNVRQAGFPGTMLHVDRGVGRYVLPLASFSWDRKFRFHSGERMQTRFGIHNDLSNARRIAARYRLFDGETQLGEKSVQLQIAPGRIGFADLDFALPKVTTDQTLRLEVRVWPQNGSGWFFDDVPVTVYAPAPLRLPAGQKLAVFDPNNAVAPFLTRGKIAFTRVEKLGDWTANRGVLLVGSEGLNRASNAELAVLGRQIVAGGRAIVLDHRALPAFLAQPLSQVKGEQDNIARLDAPSVVTVGLLNEDFRAWTTRERDQVVSWNPIETPSAGRFRVHATTVKTAPILEVEEGAGRVLFAQVNFADALGTEPAAAKLLGNLLNWTGAPSPFQTLPALLVSADPKFIGAMQGRVGLDAPAIATPTKAQLESARVIVVNGSESAARDALEKQQIALRARLKNGATLFVYGLDADGAKWLSNLTQSEVVIESFPHVVADLTAPHPLTAGLGHGDFYVQGAGNGFDRLTAMSSDSKRTGLFQISGGKVRALTQPVYLAEIPVEAGRVVVDLVRSLEYPLPSQMRVLSTTLGNTGARLDPTGSASSAPVAWKYETIDLAPRANAPLQSAGLSGLPNGKQTLRGVEYQLGADPQKMLVGVATNGALPRQMLNILINRKAERLFFLHGAAGGVPNAIYRVYYQDERARWIPGQPDPFVDATTRAGDNLIETRDAAKVETGALFLPAASVAWRGANGAGLYQMAWDNPKPDQTIESVDILLPPNAGNGSLFLAGLSLANRDETASAPTTATPPLSRVAPNVKPEQVEAQVQFVRYGFVLLKDGTIPVIYDAQGVPFAGTQGWNATISGAGQAEITLRQSGSAPKIEATRRGGQRVFTLTASDEKAPLQWRATLVASPGGLRYELFYSPQNTPPDARAKLQMTVNTLGETTTEGTGVNVYPGMLPGPAGLATLAFDRRYFRIHHGYFVDKQAIRFVSPPSDAPPVTTGREESLWWELAVP